MIKPNKRKVGVRIKGLRESRGLTLKELGEEISLAISTISSWEQGVSVPRKKTLTALSNYFNVSESWLLFGNVEEFVTDVIAHYDLDKQISIDDKVDFIDFLIKREYTVGNFDELQLYAKKQLPILEEVINLHFEKKAQNNLSLHNIGNMYPIVKEEIMQERILPLLQMLLTDKNKAVYKQKIENFLYSMLLEEDNE